MKKLIAFVLLSIGVLPVLSQLSLSNPRCQYRKDPLGVDIAAPRLSWELASAQKNVLQTAYRILVSTDLTALQKNTGNIWDSKKVNSSTSIQVPYAGKPLLSAKKYYWKVMVWDNKGNTAWSSTASWQMGLLLPGDWKNAKWIGYEEINDSVIFAPHTHLNGKKAWGARRNILPLFRKEITLSKNIKSATTFISGLGQFDFFINGKKVGDHFLDPGWTNYKKEAQYVSFDITNCIQKGVNSFGVMLGNGFLYIPGQRYRKMTGAYALPKMICKTIIEFTDGTSAELVSDESWKTAPSPIIFSSIFGGEDYDAGMLQQGWDTPGFNDHQWKNAVAVKDIPQLVSMKQEPIKIMQRFSVKTKKQLNNTTTVYDLAQNFSGIPSLTVKGNKGDTIKIYCGELLNEDGTANQKATGNPSYFTYILNGVGEESWQPQFSYTGFRYMEVHCIAKEAGGSLPEVKNMEGLHIRNAMNTLGSFSSSNELFNKTNTLIDWAIKSNSVSVFTDCPHREKLGWLEQTHLMGPSVQYNYNVAPLFSKMIDDMKSAQYADGKVPEIAPEFTQFTAPFDESPEWGSASIILPWYNYKYYGDEQTLAGAYPMMQVYVKYLSTKAKNNILSHGLGDWFDIGPKKSGFAQMTKQGITATATYYYDLTIMQQVAVLLNKTADAKNYLQLAEQVKKSFNAAFFDTQKMQYDTASQTANAMALYFGLVEPQNISAVQHALINDIKKRNNALTAGDIGYRYVLRALEDAGRSDLIFDMNSRDDVPGYGFQLKHGATALTESWQAYESVSNNHFMLGHLMEWFYSAVGGIQQAADGVAYQSIEIRPQPVGDLTQAKTSFHSPYGDIKTSWTKTADNFTLQVTIPANTRAAIFLPGAKTGIQTGSGTYTYSSQLK
jgi:hypothetical protein